MTTFEPNKSIDPYEALQLNREAATPSAIKKAYRKLALKTHPDKLPQDTSATAREEANAAFQKLSFAYAILSDPKRKERYDRTGSIEESEFDSDFNWISYFKELWTGIVSSDTIEAQIKKYQGSDEEKRDLLACYAKWKGDMNQILAYMEGSTAKDGERFEKLIREAAKEGLVKEIYKKFEQTTTTKAHKQRLKNELKAQAAFDKMSKKDGLKNCNNKTEDTVIDSAGKGDTSDDQLARLIHLRQQDRQAKMNSFFDKMEASAKKSNKRKKRTGEEDIDEESYDLPTEEEFLAIQKNLMKSKKSRKKAGNC
ncbi:hypothetical protein BDF20DRAFT_883780 [Mycotypha africana]|uniref:uncharacterized protein n=1 Tax=Mycotypha africana TaxID=64632 RepID=UPI0022FFD498|nr:uncharacterized protein BDF20DRAFT_883780 [Mycotypha africana]KAI8973718.1 hypothetical protein BDF20DRAFT_883780 [Mycotypha africana]